MAQPRVMQCAAILIPRRDRAAEQIRNNLLRNTNRNEGIICYTERRMRAVLAFRQAFVLLETGGARSPAGPGTRCTDAADSRRRGPEAAVGGPGGLAEQARPREWPVALVRDQVPPDSH